MPLLRQFPLWAWIGAAVLAVFAGIVNVVGYLGYQHQAITHLTGLTTLLGAALARHDARAIGMLGLVVGAFLAGAVVSGAIIGDSTLRLGRRYGITLMSLCILIICGFMLGGTIGTLLFERFAYRALFVPAALTGLAGVAYVGYRLWAGPGEARMA